MRLEVVEPNQAWVAIDATSGTVVATVSASDPDIGDSLGVHALEDQMADSELSHTVTQSDIVFE